MTTDYLKSFESIVIQSKRSTLGFFVFNIVLNEGLHLMYYLLIMDFIECGIFSAMFFEFIALTVISSFPQLVIFCVSKIKDVYIIIDSISIIVIVINILSVITGVIGGSLLSRHKMSISFHVISGVFCIGDLIVQLYFRIKYFIAFRKLKNESEIQPINDEENDVNMKKEHDQQKLEDNKGNADMPQYKEDDALI